MTFKQLQQRTLKVLRLVVKQLNRAAHMPGLSDDEFIDEVLCPLKNDILQDQYMLKQYEKEQE